jgi:hypothetical protein
MHNHETILDLRLWQVPTVIKGALELSIFNSGTETIPVRADACMHAVR